jgi:predicted RNase H-like HicB family nuclease
MSQQFTLIIERDPESNWLVGSVAELPGCYTQAQTMAELESNVQEAIQAYLETVGEQEVQPYPVFVGLQRIEVAA